MRKYQLNLQASVKACECKPGILTPETLTRTNPGTHSKKRGFIFSQTQTQTSAVWCSLTLALLSPLRRPEEAAHSLRADDEDLQRAVQSLDVFSCPESRFLTVPFLPRLPCSALSCSGGKVPALTVRSGLKA